MFCRNFRLGILDDPSSRWFNTSNQKNCRQTSEVFCCLWNCDYCHVSYRHQTCCFRGATIFTNINMRQSKHPCLLLLPYANLVTQCRFFSFLKNVASLVGTKVLIHAFYSGEHQWCVTSIFILALWGKVTSEENIGENILRCSFFI